MKRDQAQARWPRPKVSILLQKPKAQARLGQFLKAQQSFFAYFREAEDRIEVQNFSFFWEKIQEKAYFDGPEDQFCVWLELGRTYRRKFEHEFSGFDPALQRTKIESFSCPQHRDYIFERHREAEEEK